MNPLIKKFWADAGFEVESKRPANAGFQGEWRLLFYLKKNGIYTDIAGFSAIIKGRPELDPPCHVYILNDKEYTEEMMLRRIKLKVFF